MNPDAFQISYNIAALITALFIIGIAILIRASK